jgi:S-DNA-T family DNA segregation ATPase FtsK/SpoIIIE
VGGSARSGRTTSLALIAQVVREAEPGATVVIVSTPRSQLPTLVAGAEHFGADELGAALDAVESAGGRGSPVLLLVDDAELVDDTSDNRLTTLVSRSSGPVLVVAAGRGDVLRSQFNHWSRPLRRSKLGLLLRPDLDLDGDLLGIHLPRRLPVPIEVPGRGFVVNAGNAQLAQLAMPRPPTGP